VNFGVLFNRNQGLVDITATIVIVMMDIIMTMLSTDFLIRRINSILFDYILDIIYHVLYGAIISFVTKPEHAIHSVG